MKAERDTYTEGLALSAANRHAEAIERYEAALSERPGDIRVLFALGNTASALGMPKAAEQMFRQVLAIQPGRLEALVNLANLLRAEGRFGEAEALLAPALAQKPETPELWLALGSVYREQGDVARAAEHYREALGRRPDYAPALGNLADILADEGDFDDALSLYDRAVALAPEIAQARLNRAVLHLLRGRLAEGWRDYEARLGVPGKVPVPDHGLPKWDGCFRKGMGLLVTAEQGVGDQIMFASLIPELAVLARRAGAKLLLECEPRLTALFARSFAEVNVRASHIETRGGTCTARYDWLKRDGGAHAAIEMGSLAAILRHQIGQFPPSHGYLVPDRSEAARWDEALAEAGEGPRIGLCWRSGAMGGGRATQYAPLAAWADFIRALPGLPVSCQYDASQEELQELESLSGRKIFLPQALDQKNELDRTCAMLSALDAVISAPTAVSWLAAASCVPTAKILYDTSWTSFGKTCEPFAPSCVLMMPTRRGDWADAFAKASRWLSGPAASG